MSVCAARCDPKRAINWLFVQADNSTIVIGISE